MLYELTGSFSVLYIGVRGFIPEQASSNRACCRKKWFSITPRFSRRRIALRRFCLSRLLYPHPASCRKTRQAK